MGIEVDRPVEEQALHRGTRDRVAVALVALVLGGAGLVIVAHALRSGPSTRALGVTPSTPSVANGQLAFSGGAAQIYATNSGNTGVTNLTGPYDGGVVIAAYWPRWSPDGTRIAFSGYSAAGVDDVNGGANYDIFVMNADGTVLRNLTTSPDDVATQFSQLNPEWSPDGTKIAYDGDDGLYVMDAEGSDQTKVAAGQDASWSPDGTAIAFAHESHVGANIYTVAPDGTGLTQLTDGPGYDGWAVWSPDGTKIAFAHNQGDQGAVFVMNADGTGLASVFDQPGVDPGRPVWSPDGTQLVFEALVSVSPGTNGHPDYNYDIYDVSVDGTGIVDLTPSPERTENSPVWAPDGTKIAFEASNTLNGENAGTYDVFVMNPDGTSEQRLTTDQHAGGFDLSWQAVPAGRADP